jgi:hypothetical protein
LVRTPKKGTEAPTSVKGDEAGAAASARTRGPTTRKTIEVPEEYFFLVKLHAVQRRMKEKELWAEILEEYFRLHPNP